jgi:hypothetical protein
MQQCALDPVLRFVAHFMPIGLTRLVTIVKIEDTELRVGEDPHPLVEENYYEVQCVDWNRGFYRGGEKLYVKFKIVSSGKYLGVCLIKPYNFYDPLKRGSNLYKDLVKLSGVRANKGVRLPLKIFKNKLLKVRVETVTRDCKQTKYDEHQQYSVVREIISVEVGVSYGGEIQ